MIEFLHSQRASRGTAVDSAEIQRLRGVAKAAGQTRDQLLARATQKRHDFIHTGRDADSISGALYAARTAADSVRALQRAYDARSAQALALLDITQLEDTALVQALTQSNALDSALARSEARAVRAEALVRGLVPLAQEGERCRLLAILPCPSRKAVVVAAAASTALALGAVRVIIAR